MAAGGIDEILPTNLPCRRCKSTALTGVKCVLCGSLVHPGCVKYLKGAEIIVENKLLKCCVISSSSGDHVEASNDRHRTIYQNYRGLATPQGAVSASPRATAAAASATLLPATDARRPGGRDAAAASPPALPHAPLRGAPVSTPAGRAPRARGGGRRGIRVASGVRTVVRTLCKVYPSSGAARTVWAPPQTCCNMVADTDHPQPPAPHRAADSALLHAAQEADITEHSRKTIFDVVKLGELSEVEELVERHGAGVLRERDEWGYTPAHWAALDGSVEIMRYVVDRGGPVDLPCLGTQGPKPIHWACRKGHAAVVQVLLQSGVAVNAADFKGLTPLMTACMFGRTATAAYLLGSGAQHRLLDINGDTALHWAAYKGHADLIRLLVYSGADLQQPDHFGSTPLHLACLSGSLSCVKLLCEKSNICLEPLDKNDKTPLMLAQSHRHSEIINVLQAEQKRRSSWFPPINEFWGLLFGKSGNSKVPLVFFMCSVLLWVYPMYIVRCVPITWNLLRGSHYCFIYWNAVMWTCWVVANRRDPGYVARDSDAYRQAIRHIPGQDKWKRQRLGPVMSRLCHSCRCLRPLRAKHCRVCDRCVSCFDHHCPFIYNCVGLRNRMWFFLFVVSVAVNCSFTIYFATYCIAIEGFGLLYLLGLIEAFVFSGLGWILTCTSILHACMNLTTNEMFNYKRYPYLRDKRGRYFNPFSRGPILNLIEFFFCTSEDYEEDFCFEYI